MTLDEWFWWVNVVREKVQELRLQYLEVKEVREKFRDGHESRNRNQSLHLKTEDEAGGIGGLKERGESRRASSWREGEWMN